MAETTRNSVLSAFASLLIIGFWTTADAVTPLRTSIGLTDAQKLRIVEMHNDYRRRKYSSDMRYMTWDGELAWIAQTNSRRCKFRPSKVKQHSKYESIGENMYATQFKEDFDVTTAVKEWYKEMRFFLYYSGKCQTGQSCDNYTQIVWASTYKVGCALTRCWYVSEIGLRNALLFICHYAPSGNIRDSNGELDPIFNTGHPCTQCSDQDYCRGRLCGNSERDFLSPPNDDIEKNTVPYIIAVSVLSAMVLILLCIILFRRHRISFLCEKFRSSFQRRLDIKGDNGNVSNSLINNTTPLITEQYENVGLPVVKEEYTEIETNDTNTTVKPSNDESVKRNSVASSRRSSRRVSLPRPPHPAPKSPPPMFPAPVLEQVS